VRTLIIAWSTVLVIFIGGASWLQLSYDPANYTSKDHGDETVAETHSDDLQEDHGAKTPMLDESKAAQDTATADDASPDMETPATDTTDTTPEVALTIPSFIEEDVSIADPMSSLTETGPYGPLPVVNNRQQPWRAYARPFGGSSRPKVALLMIGAGLNKKQTQMAIKDLPSEVALGFSPYTADATTQTGQARALGHEVFVMAPMEPNDYPVNDPGPHTLLTNLTSVENLDRLYFILSRFQGYVGLVNDMGSKFTASDSAIAPVLKDIQRRGLMFVDARNSRFTLAANIARDLGIAHASNNRFIDNAITANDIDNQLKVLVNAAQRNGTALGLARPYPVTIERIRQWARTLDAQGVDLVPVTAVAIVGARQE